MVFIVDKGNLSIVDCTFVDNQSGNYILYSTPSALTATTFRNNRALGLNSGQLFWFQSRNGHTIRLRNAVFEGNVALDSSFQAYWSGYYLAQGLLTDTGLSAEKAAMLHSSACVKMLTFEVAVQLEIVYSPFTDEGPSCKKLISMYYFSHHSTSHCC